MIPDYLKEIFQEVTPPQDLQRTEEWFLARRGKATGSEVFKVLTKGRGGKPSQTRRSYAMKLASERLTVYSEQSFDTPAMKWGRDQEANAIKEFEAKFGVTVTNVGFIDHPTVPMCGVSLDGMVGDDATVEVKCKNSESHIEIVLSGECPEEHLPQIQLGLAATGRGFCWFLSFDPRCVDEHLRLFAVKVDRDQEYIDNLENEVKLFLGEVEEIVDSLKKVK